MASVSTTDVKVFGLSYEVHVVIHQTVWATFNTRVTTRYAGKFTSYGSAGKAVDTAIATNDFSENDLHVTDITTEDVLI